MLLKLKVKERFYYKGGIKRQNELYYIPALKQVVWGQISACDPCKVRGGMAWLDMSQINKWK